MSDNTAYDITCEIDPVENLDEVQAKLEQRRQEREQQTSAEASPAEPSPEAGANKTPGEVEEQKKSESKKRAAEAARKKREEAEQRREQRQQELRESRWITAGHKVREKRIELLDRVFHRLKADGAYSGTKQEFFDEGLAMLEERYSSD